MKKVILLTIFVVAGTMIIWSQVPQAMNYKAVAKDDWGVALPNKTISLRFTILQGSGTGSIVYQETHLTATNKFGLMDVEIGKGTPVISSFDLIDWSTGVYYIKIEMDPNGGTNFRLEDTPHQLLSVPYAFYAGSAGNSSNVYYSDLIGAPILSAVALSGNYFDLTNVPLLFSGNYNDLSNKPLLFSGYYEDLLNKPTLFDGTWASLEGKPVLAPVALSGNYSDLTNKPIGTGVGDILYWSGTEWVVLTAGTDGQILTMVNGTPTWGSGSKEDANLIIVSDPLLEIEPIFTRSLILSWACSNPDWIQDPRPLFFDVYVAGPSGTVKVGSNLITARVLVTMYEPGTYSWRVCVKDDLNHVTWGPLWQFVVSEEAFEDGIPDEGSDPDDNLEITNPLPLSNVDAELQIAIESPLDGVPVTTKTPTLRWACTEPDIRPLFFDVYLAGPSGTKQIGINLITPSIMATLLEPGEYSWRICVKDDLGHVTWGILWHFIAGVDIFDEDGDGTLTPADCNDHDASIFQGATEICGDGIDQDCNGTDLVCPDDPDNDMETVTDWDGNVYHTVTIGSQTWFKENLKTTHYNDGTAIPLITDAYDWSHTDQPGYCWYKNDETNYKPIHGAMYNWYAVSYDGSGSRNICPVGWHVPSDNAWINLESYLIGNGYNYDGTTTGNKIAKSLADNTYWQSSTVIGAIGNSDYSEIMNASGFSAHPSGFRSMGGDYFAFSSATGFWTSSAGTENPGTVFMRQLMWEKSSIDRLENGKNYGFSVRCIKD